MPLTVFSPPPPLLPRCLSCCSAARLLPFLASYAGWLRPLTAVQDQLHRLDELEEDSQRAWQGFSTTGPWHTDAQRRRAGGI